MGFSSLKKTFFTLSIIILISVFAIFILPLFLNLSFDTNTVKENVSAVKNAQPSTNDQLAEEPIVIPASHISTPDSVRAIYMSAWVAGSAKPRERLISMVDTTELNSIVIDVKDSTGRVSFYTDNPLINSLGSSEKRIANPEALIKELHSKNIYIIGRISVFQDPYLSNKKPEWSITKKSDPNVPWKDRKGLSFLDPANKDVWDYTIAVAKTAYDMGFDEINFDYIRYPSDGNIKDINYKLEEGATRASNLEDFFKYLSANLKKDVNIPISADLFGLTTTAVGADDMGIGQILDKALPHFDFIAPMVYPSHFPNGWNGYKNPAENPYEVIHFTMQKAVEKSVALGFSPNKIRPWLQDFDLGAKYTKDLVRAQIDATNDSGLNSWMLWDPKNLYTPEALELE